VDGHADDPLVGLHLTTHTYQALVERLHALAHELCAGRMLLMGGGGYRPEAVARCWAIMLGTLAGCVPPQRRAQFEALHDPPLAEDEESARKVDAVIAGLKTHPALCPPAPAMLS
jgi:acetoin utilization deacetylase AcuC-like enzyme